MSLFAALSLWSVMPCGPLNELPHPDAGVDSVEYCKALSRAYRALEAQDYKAAQDNASLAGQVILYEWETNAHWLIAAEAACRAGEKSKGLEKVDEFLCYADIDTQRYFIEDWWSLDRKTVYTRLDTDFLKPNGYTARPEVCFWALEDAFPNDFDQATQAEEDALYREAYRIKDLCTEETK